MVNACVAVGGMLGIGCSLAAGIWWIWDFTKLTDTIHVTVAIIMTAVAMCWALAGLCFGTCFESCSCLGRLTASMCLMGAFACQCVTLIVLATQPSCVFNNCAVGGPAWVSICAMIMYFLTGIIACISPPKGRNGGD